MNLSGKVVLITGASQGIGAACVESFRKRGAKLSLIARSESRLRAVGGREALVTAGDLTEPEVRRRAVDATMQRFGSIDVLINNAGVGMYAHAWRAPMPAVRQMFEVNLMVPLELIQLVVPYMRERHSGVIVNVGSIAGKVTLPWLTLYSVSKYALGALTDGLRIELRHQGIHTIAVCPGYVRTGFRENVLAGELPESIKRSSRFEISAEQCAEAIAVAVEREKRTVVTPAIGWALIAVARLLPWVLDWQLEQLYRRLESNP